MSAPDVDMSNLYTYHTGCAWEYHADMPPDEGPTKNAICILHGPAAPCART